jgi:hypothetical protein
VDAEADAHHAVGHCEQGPIGAGQRATVEGHPERAGRGVGRFGHPLYRGEVQPLLCRGARTLEHGEITGDTPPFRFLTLRGAGHVVGDGEVARVDALAAQLGDGKTEIHHIAGVVSRRQQDACVTVRSACHRCRLLRGW